jgi:leucyl-tRNA synthetase
MDKEYKFWETEPKWQAVWNEKGYFRAVKEDNKKKFYNLVMFPYPSGRIHIGHVRNYTIGDIIARTKKLQGFNVLNPIGWDSFGLPAENAAIDHGIHPAKWTFENIDNMKKQLKKLGLAYDWEREIATCKADYYKWNQWLFVKMYEKGLVEKKGGTVNWCPACETVLANEQVEDGQCWRCHSEVEQKELSQWYFKITEYAQQLLDDQEKLKGQWPERVITMQRNWIGRSTGLKINFKLDDEDFPIFTTRPDTIFGVTYMAIAPEHPLVDKILEESNNKLEIKKFVDAAKKESKIQRTAEGMEKKGIFTGKYVTHPFTDEQIPLYIADFVLMEYGTGAIMAVPAHDERDFQFARKYGIPIRVVIQPEGEALDPGTMKGAYTGEGKLVNSGEFNGTSNEEAMDKIIEKAKELKIGDRTINYRLKDWLLSRQRYWGTPIPMLYCEKCGIVPVPEKELPVLLPEDVDFSKGGNPLATSENFVNTKCPACGERAKRETDTMDTFVDSSWYYARYTSPKEDTKPVDPVEAKYWLDVDQYTGGIEHAVMHLLYSRFFHKVMRDLGLVQTDEPFKRLLTQGMVVANSYFCKSCHQYFPPSEAEDGKCPKCGKELIVKLDKMSKSKKNGLDPDDLVEKYGADTVRVFMLFASPPEKDLEWSDTGVEGAYRFLKRIYALAQRHADKLKTLKDYVLPLEKLNKEGTKIKKATHKAVKKVTEDFIERYHFNTGIAAMMEFLNQLNSFEPSEESDFAVLKEGILTLVHLLFPVAPHFSEEIYLQLDGGAPSLYEIAWPGYEEKLTQDDEITYAVQVNGKVRANIEMAADSAKDEVLNVAKAHENIIKYLEGKEIVREIFVPKKLVNLVVK